MKLIKAAKDIYRFQLASREKELLLKILSLYPRIPCGYQRLSKGSGLEESNQRLLEDGLAEARVQNQKSLQALLADPQRLKQAEHGWWLTLSTGDLDWVLQVLNDVRIGSWIRLGSPEPLLNALAAEAAPDFWAMEAAGYLQMRFLELLEG